MQPHHTRIAAQRFRGMLQERAPRYDLQADMKLRNVRLSVRFMHVTRYPLRLPSSRDSHILLRPIQEQIRIPMRKFFSAGGGFSLHGCVVHKHCSIGARPMGASKLPLSVVQERSLRPPPMTGNYPRANRPKWTRNNIIRTYASKLVSSRRCDLAHAQPFCAKLALRARHAGPCAQT